MDRVFRLAVLLWLTTMTIHTDQASGFGLKSQPSSGSSSSSRIERRLEAATLLQVSEPMPWPSNTDAYGAFQQDRDWAFAFSGCTVDAEGSYVVERAMVEGEIPDCLKGGTFYRNGPAKFERNGHRYEHFLDGDGFVVAFKFLQDGRLRYTGRFVETEFFLREQEQDDILYRNAFGTQKKGCPFQNALDFELKNVANTNALAWGGRLFALWEAGAPYELDPETLETLNPSSCTSPLAELGSVDCRTRGVTIDEGGPIDKLMKVGKTFTAHPVVIKKEERMVAFASMGRANTDTTLLHFIEYDRNWNPLSTIKHHFTHGMAPHAFSVSKDYYCFFQNRSNLDFASYILGGKPLSEALRFFLRKPAILHLVPRNDSNKRAIKLTIPHYFNIHTVAEALQVNGKLILYSTGWNLNDAKFFPPEKVFVSLYGSFGGEYPDFVSEILPPPTLYRTVIDLGDAETTPKVDSHEPVVKNLVVELPTADDADPDRFIYGVAYSDTSDYLPPTGLCKVDVQNDTVECWWSGHRTFVGEAISVAKRKGDPGSWILTVVSDAAQKRGSLVILDSECFSSGPVARIHLKHHLTYGLHSSFSF